MMCSKIIRFIVLVVIGQMVLSGCSVSDSDPDDEPEKSVEVPQVDNAVNEFMSKYNVPGVSVAVTKDGKLVYAKSYGMADKENNKEVSNSSLFRIASVSKPVTSVMIMKLVEEGKISLDNTVFGEGALLGMKYGTKPYSENLKKITISHLLHHTAGGWPNDGSDPMFKNPDMTVGELISWTLDNYTLSYVPGTHYAYSNFGYSVLGRVIEEVTGRPYEGSVISDVLQEMGITDMQIAGNTESEKKANEVKYYGQNSENPYIYNVARMDAHGGWIASATDLARFMVKVDGFSNKSDILDSSTIQEMISPSQANQNYAAGWAVNSTDNWWHNGSLPGTSSILVRASMGMNWVVLCNSRAVSASFNNDLDALMWKAVNNSATEWPDQDLFE